MVSAIGILKGIGIALVSILLLADLVLLGVAIPGQNLLSSPAPWKKIVREADLFAVLGPAIEQSMVSGGVSAAGISPQSRLGPLVKKSLSREWFEEQTDSLIDHYFEYVNGGASSPRLLISLEKPKEAFLQEIHALPEFQALDSAAKQEMENQVRQSIPNEIDWASKMELGQAGQENPFEGHKQMVSLLRQAFFALVVLALVFAALLVALLRQAKVLVAFGIVFLLAGILLFAVGALATSLSNQAIGSMQADASFQPLLQNFSQSVISEFSQQTNLFAAGYFIAGIACLAGFWALAIIRRKKKK